MGSVHKLRSHVFDHSTSFHASNVNIFWFSGKFGFRFSLYVRYLWNTSNWTSTGTLFQGFQEVPRSIHIKSSEVVQSCQKLFKVVQSHPQLSKVIQSGQNTLYNMWLFMSGLTWCGYGSPKSSKIVQSCPRWSKGSKGVQRRPMLASY